MFARTSLLAFVVFAVAALAAPAVRRDDMTVGITDDDCDMPAPATYGSYAPAAYDPATPAYSEDPSYAPATTYGDDDEEEYEPTYAAMPYDDEEEEYDPEEYSAPTYGDDDDEEEYKPEGYEAPEYDDDDDEEEYTPATYGDDEEYTPATYGDDDEYEPETYGTPPATPPTYDDDEYTAPSYGGDYDDDEYTAPSYGGDYDDDEYEPATYGDDYEEDEISQPAYDDDYSQPAGCSTGPIQCCNQVQSLKSAKESSTDGVILALLNNILAGDDVPIGLGCSPIIGASGQCNAQTVCCDNVNQQALIGIQCNSFNGGLGLLNIL